VISLFQRNTHTAAVAYPLRASNREHLWAQFQDLEYLTAGYMKLSQVHPQASVTCLSVPVRSSVCVLFRDCTCVANLGEGLAGARRHGLVRLRRN
jgi:hypothetical protein